jgi:hypothetical protein
MKKVKGKAIDELRPEYKRSDFATLVRGKYAKRAATASNVVVLDPDVAEAFPNDQAVNKALRRVLKSGKAVRRAAARPTRGRRVRSTR